MHLLRHSFATHFLESYIQKLLAQKNFCAIKNPRLHEYQKIPSPQPFG